MKPTVPAHVREAERQTRIQEARTAALCADITAQLIEAGWTDVCVQPKAIFIAISGYDPAGRNHSAAEEDGQSLADFLIAIGVPPPPRKRQVEPEPVKASTAPERIEAPSPPSGDDRVAPLGFKDEPDPALEEIERLRARVKELEEAAAKAVEPLPLSPDPAKHMIPDEIRNLMEGEETLPQAKQRLWPILNAELGELKNQEALFNKTIPRRAEVEQLISILARLGEG